MTVQEVIKKRRSIRKFKKDSIPEDKLNTLLEAARLAQSAGNKQGWKFILVTDANLRKRMVDEAEAHDCALDAPLVIAACGTRTDHVMLCGQPSLPVDLAIAVENMALQAVELGLGSVWLGHFKEAPVKKLLNVPEPARIVALLIVGYPDENPPPRERKTMEEIVCRNRWA